MRKFHILLFIFSISWCTNAQELNCRVNINSQEIGISNKQIFVTLQSDVTDYMNNTKWTNLQYGNQEKIDCSLTINILEAQSASQFRGTIQLLVSRPVYDSTYLTPILSFNDSQVSFSYQEFQPLIYNRIHFPLKVERDFLNWPRM